MRAWLHKETCPGHTCRNRQQLTPQIMIMSHVVLEVEKAI